MNTTNKRITLTFEELSKVITSAIFGYTYANSGEILDKEQIKTLYDATIAELDEAGDEFLQDMVKIHDEELHGQCIRELNEDGIVWENDEDE